MKCQAGLSTSWKQDCWRNINYLRYADDHPHGRRWRGPKEPLDDEEELNTFLIKMKEESEKAGLKCNIQKTNIMASSPITSWKIDGKQWKQWQTLFFWAPKSLQMVTVAMKLKDIWSLEENNDKHRQHIKKQRYDLANKAPSSQSYGFSSGHVWMWELEYKESWALKMVLNCGVEDSWESLGLQGDPTTPS